MSLPLLETLSWADVPQAPGAEWSTFAPRSGSMPTRGFRNRRGEGYEASEYLALIDQHRQHYTLISGLAHANQSGRQAHNSEITWLTSAEHPGLDGFRNTLSLDQAAADHLGYVTRFPSIVLGTTSPQRSVLHPERGDGAGRDEPGGTLHAPVSAGQCRGGGQGNPAVGGRRQHPRSPERRSASNC